MFDVVHHCAPVVGFSAVKIFGGVWSLDRKETVILNSFLVDVILLGFFYFRVLTIYRRHFHIALMEFTAYQRAVEVQRSEGDRDRLLNIPITRY